MVAKTPAFTSMTCLTFYRSLTKLRIQILTKLMSFERRENFTSMEAKISLPPPFGFAESKHEFHLWAQFQHHHRKKGPANTFLPIVYKNMLLF